MPSTTKGEAPPSSATAKKRAFIPPVVNPYSEFTQPQFDAFVSDITTKILDALHGGRKKDKGKGKDMSLFGGNRNTTSVEQGDAMGFEQFSFSNKVRNGLNGSFPLDVANVLTDEEEQDEDTEREEQEEVDGGVEENIPWPTSDGDEEQEPPEPERVIIRGAGGAEDPIVIDILDSDEEASPVNGKCNVGDHEGFQGEEESNNEDDEDDDIPEQQQVNLIAIDSDEEPEHDEEQPAQVQESDHLDADELQIEERVRNGLPASSPALDDQDTEEEHNDDTEIDNMHTAYESFVANMNTSGSTMPYSEGPDLHAGTSSYSSEITESYYSLYPYDDTSQGYVDPLCSPSQTSNQAHQRSADEEGMSWTYPPAFPPRRNSVSRHGARQSEESRRVFPVSTAGYGIPTSVVTSYADAYTADGYAPVDGTRYHSVYQAEQSVLHLSMEPTELVSGPPFEAIDIYADLTIDPSLDVAKAVDDVSHNAPIKGIKSDVPADEEPVVKEPRVDVRVTAGEELDEEESFQIPAIEIDATDVDPLAPETTTYGISSLASMLTPDLRPLMELPLLTSPTVGLFPTTEKSQDAQVGEVDLVDSERLLSPNSVIYPHQQSGSLEQAVSALPLVKSPVEASPAPEPVFKNSQVLTETLREELDTLEQALTVSDPDPTAQATTAPPLNSTTSGSQVATLLESEPSAFTFHEESQPSTLEEIEAFGHTDEKVEYHDLRGSSVLSDESHLDSRGQNATRSPQRRQNGISRELKKLQDGASTTVLDGPRLRRTTSSKSDGPTAANASVPDRGHGGAIKRHSPRKRTSTPMMSMPPPSDVPKRSRILRSSSRASSVASDQSFQKPPSKSSSLDYPSSPLEPRLDTTLRTEATSSTGDTPTVKKRKRRPRTSMSGDEEYYMPNEVEQTHKKRKTEIHDVREADSSLAGVDLGEALAFAEEAPDLKAKNAFGDEGSPPKSIDASPSTLQASTLVEGSAEDGEQQHSVTQSNDNDSDLTPLPSGDEGIETREALSPSKRARKWRSKPMDPHHTSHSSLTDSEESESEAESASRHETVRRINMRNGYETEVEVPVQDSKRSTPTHEEDSDRSFSDSSGSEGSLYSDTVGSTEESTTIVEGAPEDLEVKVDGLEPEFKSLRRKSKRMRRIRRDNLAYKPSLSSESEGNVEQLLEQEEEKERKGQRLKALRKARRTRGKKAALAGGNMVDANTTIKSRKRKRHSEAVKEDENGKGKQKQVEDSVGDSEPKKKRVKKDHHPVKMDGLALITNGVKSSDRALQEVPVESDFKFAEPLEPPSQEDLGLAAHKPVVLNVPFSITDEKDKSEAGGWWFGRLFSKKTT